MNIVIEYLSRTGVAEGLMSTPCSIFFTYRTGDRFVLCVNKCCNDYSVKRWNIYQCESSHALPPFEEFTTDNLFNDDRVVTSDVSILNLRHKGISTIDNCQNRPMSNEMFEKQFDHYLNDFTFHNHIKEKWLLNSFLNVYHPEIILISLNIKRNLVLFNDTRLNKEIFDCQLYVLEKKYPKSWKYWLMWRKHMLDFEGIPGEFAFQSLIKTLY